MNKNHYYYEYIPDIENIVDSLRKEHLSIFCGAGATADATKTTWVNLFKEELAVIDKEETDNYKLAEYYKLHYGRNKLVNAVENIFSDVGKSKHIEQLLKLPVFDFWTTNFDCIIEDMINDKTGLTSSVIFNSENIIRINENKKYRVFKLNGSIKDANSMILTASDYANYKYRQTIFIELLKKELILNTFLFVGYSFEDKLVLECLNDIKQCFPSLNQYHYRIEKRSQEHIIFQNIEQKYFEDNYNIKTIFVDDFEQIDDFIETVYNTYILKNIYISGSFRHLSSKEEDRANILCKILVDNLINHDFNIHTGDGKRLGSYIISNASRNLISKNSYYKNRLKIMPYIDHTFKAKETNDEQRILLVKKMMQDCSVCIFMYGQNEVGEVSQGVLLEYKEAKENHMLTIPIPITGYAAEYIANDLYAKGIPGYLEKYFDILVTEENPNKIVKIIMEILMANSI